MAAAIRLLISILVIFAVVELDMCMGNTYKVGDKAGWTSSKNVSYGDWADSKTFHVGDFIVFSYDNSTDNVLRVSRASYKACNASHPFNAFTSGNDSIPLQKTSHLFFISGVRDHCKRGMSVDVRVLAAVLPPAPAAAPAPAPTPVLTVPSPATFTSDSFHPCSSWLLHFAAPMLVALLLLI